MSDPNLDPDPDLSLSLPCSGGSGFYTLYCSMVPNAPFIDSLFRLFWIRIRLILPVLLLPNFSPMLPVAHLYGTSKSPYSAPDPGSVTRSPCCLLVILTVPIAPFILKFGSESGSVASSPCCLSSHSYGAYSAVYSIVPLCYPDGAYSAI